MFKVYVVWLVFVKVRIKLFRFGLFYIVRLKWKKLTILILNFFMNLFTPRFHIIISIHFLYIILFEKYQHYFLIFKLFIGGSTLQLNKTLPQCQTLTPSLRSRRSRRAPWSRAQTQTSSQPSICLLSISNLFIFHNKIFHVFFIQV